MSFFFDFRFAATTALFVATLWVLLGAGKVAGKAWLMGFVALSWALLAIYYVPAWLLRNGQLSAQQHRDFISAIAEPAAVVAVLSWVVLLAYALRLRAGAPAAQRPEVDAAAPRVPDRPAMRPPEPPSPPSSPPIARSPPAPARDSKAWQRFYAVVPVHESVRSFLESFVGEWPTRLEPSRFEGGNLPAILERLASHIGGPYPVASLRAIDEPPAPDYRVADGKIARASSPLIDALICQVIPRRELSGSEPHVDVWRLIEKHAGSPLAKLLFALPRVLAGSEVAASGKAGILVWEDLKIQVYKGVENALFGAYESLPEGGYLSDEGVEDWILRLTR